MTYRWSTAWIRWALIALILVTNLIPVTQPALAFLVFLLPITFAALHSAITFGARNTLVIFAIIMVVAFFSEFVGVHTGFPFGAYHYNADGINGIIWVGVPPLVTFSYVSMAYTCYITARIILGLLGQARRGMLVGLSAVSAMLMASWDLAFDPAMSTVKGLWIWDDGGAYFGVPIQNFVGWFLTTFVFFLLVTAYLNRFATERLATGHPRLFRAEVLAAFAANVIALVIHGFLPGATDITQAMGIVALFALGTPLVTAAVRLASTRPTDELASAESS